MTRPQPAFAAALLLWLLANAAAQTSVPANSSSNLQVKLERLATSGNVLMIAAHPDDEHTALLAYLALGRRLRTGYLSLTRGEGGQNVIGPEKGHLLGVIREQELLAARRLDGAEQFFTSAVDFGYSKTAEETLHKWDRDRILGEIVAIIREFQPDTVILRWSGTPADGHGQHQAAGILGLEAVQAAADPARYSSQKAKAWTTKRVFQFRRNKGAIAIDTGAYDPLLGMSYAQLAGVSTSQHRSQAMGAPQVLGPLKVYLDPAPGFPEAPADPFGGVDASPLLRRAALEFQPKSPQESIPLLLQARREISAVHKRNELDELILACAGVAASVTAPQPHAPPGTEIPVRINIINRSPSAIRFESVEIPGAGPVAASSLDYNVPLEREVRWRVQSPVPTALFHFRIGDESVEAVRPLIYRFVDKVLGERTQPFVPTPPVSVSFRDASTLFPNADSRRVPVRVKSYAGSVDGTVALALPPKWLVEPTSQKFHLIGTESEITLQFRVTPPEDSTTADAKAVATVAGSAVDSSVVVIRYPHIPTQTVMVPAASKLIRTGLRVLARTVGYIEGAGDEVPDAIRQLGCDVTLLTADDLANGDLDHYDAIVTGVRAFNLREDLRANAPRLQEYVRRGGSLIVQYNTASATLTDLGPFPIKLESGRVSVEEAPVRILNPRSAVLRFPNVITAADFDGWVQERGLYFPAQWDARYEAPVASNDPGENPLPGGILFAKYGEGAYIYTSYSWFRQLPAGVAGAYRIFANLLSQ